MHFVQSVHPYPPEPNSLKPQTKNPKPLIADVESWKCCSAVTASAAVGGVTDSGLGFRIQSLGSVGLVSTGRQKVCAGLRCGVCRWGGTLDAEPYRSQDLYYHT